MPANANEKTGCLSKIFPFLKRSKNTNLDESYSYSTSDDLLPYRVRDDFLSQAEFSFYKVLSSLGGSRFIIQSKVRLADIFYVARPNENFAYINKINQRHLDFLACNPITMKPIFGVELDDSSHQRNDRKDGDEFLDEVFEAANLPLMRVPAQREYNTREITAQIAPFLSEKAAAASASVQPENITKASSVPLCPKCGIPMVLRTAAQGDHKGRRFYGCQNYPKCREMKPLLIQEVV